jgi:hypothetical protein
MTFYNQKRNETIQTHIVWGVKSLPWLILTNKQHIVHIEGFNLNELDKKIKQLKED